MSNQEVFTDLLGLQGWEIVDNGVAIEGGVVTISIVRSGDTGHRCMGCGQLFL